MRHEEINEAAEAALKWMQSPAGHDELHELAEKYGFCDGWHIVYAIRKVSPMISRYEDICAVVEALRILRRVPAIRARMAKEAAICATA